MSNDAGPEADEYFRITSTQQPHSLLVEALKYVDSAANKLALDMGCGAGRDTRGLLAKGFKVVAIDIEAKAGSYITELVPSENVKFVCTPFDKFAFDAYDFINAQWCLSFNPRFTFNQVMTSVKTALKPNAILTGNFFGVHDSWNTAASNMTFLSEAQVRAWFEDMDVLYFEERERDETVVDGEPKHWHTFEFIVRQPFV